uniref:Laminin G domain-containing protein n=1 Tax=Eptatretus burgeri TaxID=7764 RepID=A0A8C4QQ74_EPTBU
MGDQVGRLQDQIGGLQDNVTQGKNKHKDLSRNLDNVMAMLKTIPSDTGAKIDEAKRSAAVASKAASGLLEQTMDLNEDLVHLQHSYNKLSEDTRKANDAINDAGKDVAEARDKVNQVDDEVNRLLEKLKPIKKLESNLNRNISQLRDLIKQARKQAASIKVSVQSGSGCVRTYHADIKKGTYNMVTLNVRTTVADNLLFYLPSADTSDFLAIEMRKGKVIFQWDVGSGVGRVEYPSFEINTGKWYRIEAERSGRNGSLIIRPSEGGPTPMREVGQAPKGYTILDVDNKAPLFVGGMKETAKKHDVVKRTTFTGCMGEAFLDGKSIGLWNFRTTGGDCSGCVVRYMSSFLCSFYHILLCRSFKSYCVTPF